MTTLITYYISCYNEVNTIIEAINDIVDLPVEKKEIIVVDNNSYDGTIEKLKNYQIENPKVKIIFNQKNLGSESFLIAKNIAKGKYFYNHHADREYDHLKTLEMLELAEKNNLDVVFGSRLKKKIITEGYIKLLKKNIYYLGTIVLTSICNILYRKKFTDILGTKLFKLESIINIPYDTLAMHTGEFYYVSRLMGSHLKMSEIEIDYSPRKFGRKSIKWFHLFIGIYIFLKMKIYFVIKRIR
tara:strand:+ start:1986 stop:2711 length:726 start_codon:yes stop_codon:yes gene_type:complete